MSQQKAIKANPATDAQWSVFNSGACIAEGLTLDQAKDYLTDERIARGWNAVYCIVIDNSHKWESIESESTPVAAVEDWPNDSTPRGIVPLIDINTLPVGTKLYSHAQRPGPDTTVEPNSQQWKGMDGCTAWWLIERHADNWSDVGQMMQEWLEANK